MRTYFYFYTAKKAQPVTMLFENRPKQDFAAHIVQQHGQQNIVQACFHQRCYRLGVFCCVHEVFGQPTT
jgi:hypothetical protein